MTTNPPALGVPNPKAAYALLWATVALTLPALGARLAGFDPAAEPILGLVLYGTGIVAAAFLLTWAAEVAEIDIGSGLAVVFLALVTVLPEYAVDMNLAWSAATDPHRQSEALANMTGANRLLIGVGWPVVALIVWYRESRSSVLLGRGRSGDVVWLLAATLYSLVVPLKGNLAWYDALVLFGIYAVYVRGSAGREDEHGALVGPPRAMGAWARRPRHAATLALFVWSAGAILASSEPFVLSLENGGDLVGVDRTLMIQWLAPLASEAPEFVVTVLLTLRGRAAMGLGALISSKVNQWTLLVGGVPVAYAVSCLVHGRGFAAAMPIDDRQVEELWLTGAQSAYAVATIADLEFSLGQALAILGLFLVQFVGTLVLERTGHHAVVTPFHVGISVLYGLLALERFVSQRLYLLARWRAVWTTPARPPEPEPQGKTPDESDA